VEKGDTSLLGLSQANTRFGTRRGSCSSRRAAARLDRHLPSANLPAIASALAAFSRMNPRQIAKTALYGWRRFRRQAGGILRGVPLLREALNLPRNGSVALADLTPADGSVREVEPARTFERPLPRLPRGVALPWEFARQRVVHLPATCVATLTSARFWGHYGGAVFTAAGTLLPELSKDVWGPQLHSAHTRWRLPALRFLPGRTLSLVTPEAASNYHHWTMDVLPRAGLVRRAGWRLEDFDHVLIKSEGRPFQREGLARLGIPEGKLIEVNDRTHLRVESLVVPSIRDDNTAVSREDVAFVRNLFLGAEPARSDARRRLYLSRRDAAFRRVRNEEEIRRILQRHGFEEISLSGLTVVQQARLLAEAAVVVAPQGAALANLVFANPATRVVDLLAPGWIAPYAWGTCALLGLEYAAIIGEGDRTPEGVLPQGIRDDLQVDPEQLEAVLADLR
jgi:capsular polysaccharide biosynthesis protein